MLQKQHIGVSFTRGIDQKTDEFLNAKLETLENATFDTANTIKKDGGYSALTFTSIDGNTITSGKRLAVRKNELLIETATALHAVVRGGTNGYRRVTDSFVRATAEVTDLFRSSKPGSSYFQEIDVAKSGNMSCWVWVEPGGKVRVSIYDETTGAAYLVRHDLSGSDSLLSPRVVATASQFVIATRRVSDTSYGYNTVSFATPTTVSARTNWFADAWNSTGQTDIIYDSGTTRVYFAYGLAVGGFRVAKTDAAALTVATSRSVADANHDPNRGCALVRATDGTLMVGTITGASNSFRVCAVPDAMGSEVKQLITTAYRYLVGIETSTANTVMFLYDTATVGGTSTQRVSKVTVPTANTTWAGPTVVGRSLSVSTKPWRRGSQVYIGATYHTALAQTMFVIGCGTDSTSTGVVGAVARLLPDSIGQNTGTGSLSQPTSVFTAGDVASFPVVRKGDIQLINGTDHSPRGVSRVDLDFGGDAQRTEAGGAVIFAGALPLAYDGAQVFEAGFDYAPDDAAVVLSDGGVGVLSAGTYAVRVVWTFTDAVGRKWRSTPSVAKSLTLVASRQLSVTAPSYRVTKMHAAGTVSVEVYVTEANGTIYYLAATTDNTTTADTVSVSHNVADSTLIGNEILYTTGDALDAEPYPAHRVACVHQSRYAMAGLENPYAVRFTDVLVDFEAMSTSYVYELIVSPEKGEIVALKSLDDKLVIFCERGIWVVFGQGPDRLGLNSTYSTPQTVVEDIGCKIDSPDSVLVTPDGCWFRSSQGLRFLTRGLQVARQEDGKFLGAEVDPLVNGCVSATLVPEKSQVRFYTGTIVLVYDYQWQQWSTFTDHAAVDAIVWNGSLVHLRTDGTQYTAGGYARNDVAFYMRVTTGWIAVAGITGCQRVYEAQFAGQMVNNDAEIEVRFGVDGRAAFSAAVVDIAMGQYTVGDMWQLRARPPVQKCASIRLDIRETESSGGSGGFSLSRFGLTVGVKKGAAKLSNAKSG